ncbi:MAG: hypothetical protein L0Y50_00710 [Beijerinckiaceae bacterium]|nr:hypothetical protein [Beijerinckiaceae bacterium]MCI0734794.1 hypothetical protein [Beijerinckiaceae bacterium]
MFAIILPALNAVFGSFINPFVHSWIKYKQDKLIIEEKGFEAAAKSDQAVMESVIEANVRMAALKVQVYGTPINRFIVLIAGVPAAMHFGFVFIDTILASEFAFGAAVMGVPKLPAPYDTFEWAIVSSFFLVHAVNLGKSNVSQWFDRQRVSR